MGDVDMQVDEIEQEAILESSPFKEELQLAVETAATAPEDAIPLFMAIINSNQLDTDEFIRVKEQSIYKLGKVYVELQRCDSIVKLLGSLRPFFANIPKAKTAKITRTLIDNVSKIPGTEEVQMELCKECIEWCKAEKRTFLRQRVETKVIFLYFLQKNFVKAVAMLNQLLYEVKKLDDKQLLVEVHLLESRVHHALANMPKARAALTASRTNANAIYVAPLMQASIDKMSGILCAEEADHKTSYSYFFEATEAYAQSGAQPAETTQCFKYMLLAKVMHERPEEVESIANSTMSISKSPIDIEAIMAIARAAKSRSLKEFEAAKVKFAAQLDTDVFIVKHLETLYEMMLEGNLAKIIAPFSRVEIDHVAKLIDLPADTVQQKLSQMILDKKFYGTLEQGKGELLVFDEPPTDKSYDAALQTISNMSLVVDTLFKRAKSQLT